MIYFQHVLEYEKQYFSNDNIIMLSFSLSNYESSGTKNFKEIKDTIIKFENLNLKNKNYKIIMFSRYEDIIYYSPLYLQCILGSVLNK